MFFRIKRLEQSWNRFFIRLLGRFMRTPPLEKPDWGARPYRVLYLRHDKIGDMILATSLIDAIATSHPTITLDVLASPSNAPVLEGNPHVSSIILWDKARPSGYARLWHELRSRRYDAVVDCMVLSPSTTTLLLMLASGARQRIGIGGRINDYALTIRVQAAQSPVHHIDHSAVLVMAFGVNPDEVDWHPRIYFSDDELMRANQRWEESNGAAASTPRRRLLLNISAGQSPRRWPDDRYIALIRHLQQCAPEVDVLVISAPRDSERAVRIAHGGRVSYVATPELRDALALVAAADFVVTPDTGIAHAASACRIPAVVLIEKKKKALWGSYRTPGRHVVNEGKTLATLPLAPVLAAVDELLEMSLSTC
jgi:ADP-heptose:LPS heptosyltransferase